MGIRFEIKKEVDITQVGVYLALVDFSQVQIRKAQSQDLEALSTFVNRAYRGETGKKGWTTESDLLGGQRTDPESLSQEIVGENQVILLFEWNQILKACVYLRRENQSTYLGMLTVDPEIQTGGMGKYVISQAEEWAKNNWQTQVMRMTVISLRKELINWYLRRGYQLTLERQPFPYGDEKFGLPQRPDLEFVVLKKNLGGLQSNFPLCLAPMVGLTHVGLRQVIREFLPANAYTIWPTEMLSSRRLKGENLSETAETKKSDQDIDLVPQILGNDEENIRIAIEKLKSWGAIGIDINMGCPVQKALKHNYGVALMGDSDYAAQVVAMAVRNSLGLPISVKLRAGHQSNMVFLITFAKKLEAAGAAWLTLHPRTAEQKRRGSADWNQITELKKNLQIPLVGNGDIQTAEDVFEMLKTTNCDLVMAGRALAARPWMMWQVGEALGYQPPRGREGQRAPQTPEEEGMMYGYCLMQLVHSCRQYFTEDQSLRKIRFYIRTTSVWLEFGHELIKISTKQKTLSDIENGLRQFFSQSQRMVQRTELRQ